MYFWRDEKGIFAHTIHVLHKEMHIAEFQYAHENEWKWGRHMEGIKESIWRQDVILPEYPVFGADTEELAEMNSGTAEAGAGADSVTVRTGSGGGTARAAAGTAEKTEVAVIGGGLTGILTAYFLRKAGKQVMLFEADRIGSGQSGRTTAKITSQHGLFYGKYWERLGEARLLQYAQANEEAIREYRRLVWELSDSMEAGAFCDWLDCDSYLYAQDPREISALKKEAECAAKLGIRAGFVEKCDLSFPIAGAVRFRGQACFHPLKFLSALLPGLEAYEKSRVEDVEESDSGTSILRINGHTVEAEQVVFACHYPFPYRPGYYFLRLHQERSYVLAVETKIDLKDLYYPAEGTGLSVRPILLPGGARLAVSAGRSGGRQRYTGGGSGDDFFADAMTDTDLGHGLGHGLLLGGMGHRTGERAAGSYENLYLLAKQFDPNCRVLCRYSAQDAVSLDELPYIGYFSSVRKNWYVATGFKKWGMTHAMIAARRITSLIAGESKADEESVFRPGRFLLSASAESMLTEGLQVAKGLSGVTERAQAERTQAERTQAEQARAEQVQADTGERQQTEQQQAAEQSDAGERQQATEQPAVGEHHRCTHLGCRLTWNPEENSWDCPCHGSRFAENGQVLDGPATRPLKTDI